MELRQLNTFRAVARLMSFHGAAKELGYAQSTVSAQIQGLEQSLGVELFSRMGKRIALTDAGERLLAYADRLVALGERAEAEVSGMGRVEAALDVVMAESLVLLLGEELAGRMASGGDGARLRLVAGSAREATQAVASGLADLGVTLAEPPDMEGVSAQELGSVRLALGEDGGLPLLGQERAVQARVWALRPGDGVPSGMQADFVDILRQLLCL